jgi:hypothetical protein
VLRCGREDQGQKEIRLASIESATTRRQYSLDRMIRRKRREREETVSKTGNPRGSISYSGVGDDGL